MTVTNHTNGKPTRRENVEAPKKRRRLLGGLLRWKDSKDPLESPDGLKSVKNIVAALESTKATKDTDPKRHKRMLVVAAERIASGASVSVDYKGVMGLANLCMASADSEREELLGMFREALARFPEKTREKQQLKVQKALRKELGHLTSGLRADSLTMITMPDSGPIEAIACVIEQVGKARTKQRKEGYIPEEETDKEMLNMLLKGIFANGIDDYGEVTLTASARMACIRAAWENGECREKYLDKMLKIKDPRVAICATEILLTQRTNGWKILMGIVKKEGKTTAAEANLVASNIILLGNEDANDFEKKCLEEEETWAVMLRAVANAFAGKLVEIPEEVAAVVEKSLEAGKEKRRAALELMGRLKKLPQESKLYDLARDGHEDSIELIKRKEPRRLDGILKQMYADKSTETKSSGIGKDRKKKTTTEYLWKRTVRGMLASRNEEVRDVAVGFLISMNKNPTWEFAIENVQLKTIKKKAEELEPKKKGALPIFTRILRWAVKDERRLRTRTKALTYLKTKGKLDPKIYGGIVAEIGRKTANKRTIRLALHIIKRKKKIEGDAIPRIEDLIDSHSRVLGVPVVAALASCNVAVAEERVRKVLMARNPNHANDTALEDTRAILQLLPKVAPELGEDEECMNHIRKLAVAAPGECLAAIEEYANAGSEMARSAKRGILEDADKISWEKETKIAMGDAYLMIVSIMAKQEDENAAHLLWDEIVPSLVHSSTNGSAKQRMFADTMLTYLTVDIASMAGQETGENKEMANEIMQYLPEVLDRMSKSKNASISHVATGMLKHFFSKEEN